MVLIVFNIQKNSGKVAHTGAKLSNFPDYWMVLILTQVLTGYYLLLFYMWAVPLIRGELHLDISFICWFRVIRVLFYGFWSLQN